jgi:hypothetical protein
MRGYLLWREEGYYSQRANFLKSQKRNGSQSPREDFALYRSEDLSSFETERKAGCVITNIKGLEISQLLIFIIK